jgi:TrmH family RNA methyltransferase
LVSDNIIDQISLQVSSSGMIAIFAIPEQSKDFDTNSVILAQVSDPGNLGTIVRTCAAFGILNIICINCCDVWSPKVVQSAVGNLSKVNIINLSWQEMINYKLKNNLKICGLVVDSQNSIKNIKNNSYILVIGNEANGIPQEWQKDCDILATIKMQNNVESLNASIAAAIAIYEIKNF